jgi:hydrogenase/urease accessory protein HupE
VGSAGVAARLAAQVAALLLVTTGALSHPLAPSLLELRELDPGRLAVRWKTPALAARGAVPRPVLPDGCAPEAEPDWTREGTGVVQRFVARCVAPDLVGRVVGVDGLGASRTDALLRVELADGRAFREVLSGDRARFEIPVREQPLRVASGYVGLGVEHILGGLDHLAFVFGLLLLVGPGRALFWTITAFTLGHSATLSLAALGFVALPSRPIEVGIAASIVVLGVELVRQQGGAPLTAAAAPAGAAVFGLLHGLGFASALTDVGLPAEAIPLALFSFNLGVELGQLAFVASVLVLGALLRPALGMLPSRARWLAPYGVGSFGAFLLFDRLLG